MQTVQQMLEKAINKGSEPHPDCVLVIVFENTTGRWEVDKNGIVLKSYPMYANDSDENFKGLRINLETLELGNNITAFNDLNESITFHGRMVTDVRYDND